MWKKALQSLGDNQVIWLLFLAATIFVVIPVLHLGGGFEHRGDSIVSVLVICYYGILAPAIVCWVQQWLSSRPVAQYRIR